MLHTAVVAVRDRARLQEIVGTLLRFGLADVVHSLGLSRWSTWRSTEAEVREILNESVSDRRREGLGTRMARIAAEVGGVALDLARSGAPSEPIDFT